MNLYQYYHTYCSARLFPSGSIDTTFGNNGRAFIVTAWGLGDAANTYLIQSGERYLQAGGCGGDFCSIRLLSDGSLDSSYSSNGLSRIAVGPSIDEIRVSGITSDGKILQAGRCRTDTPGTEFCLVRLNTDGEMDLTFGNAGKVFTSMQPDADNYPTSMAIDVNGKFVLTGLCMNTTIGGFHECSAGYNSDGTLDTNYGVDGRVFSP